MPNNNMKKIPLIKPYITDAVKARVCDVLDSGFLTEGPVTREFEDKVKQYIGCDHALAVTSCTTGLEIALRSIGIQAGDEVIIPDYTYPATADAIAIVGAKTIIVDVDPDTMNIDYRALEKAITPQTKAILPVSIFGNPLDYSRLNQIKQKYELIIIEDAACSIGARYQGEPVGNLADISVFSLHPRKFITTGEGGMITTNNSQWADWILSYKHFGMGTKDSRLTANFERIGTNSKMSDLLAAVALVQMDNIDDMLSRRRELAENYIELLKDDPNVQLPLITPDGQHSYQSFCVFIKKRNAVMEKLRNQGIEVQIGTYALHMHKAFHANSNCRIQFDMPGSRFAFHHCLVLPLYHDLTFDEQNYIVHQLKKEIS